VPAFSAAPSIETSTSPPKERSVVATTPIGEAMRRGCRHWAPIQRLVGSAPLAHWRRQNAPTERRDLLMTDGGRSTEPLQITRRRELSCWWLQLPRHSVSTGWSFSGPASCEATAPSCRSVPSGHVRRVSLGARKAGASLRRDVAGGCRRGDAPGSAAACRAGGGGQRAAGRWRSSAGAARPGDSAGGRRVGRARATVRVAAAASPAGRELERRRDAGLPRLTCARLGSRLGACRARSKASRS
jgi:hypothetical protein